MMPSQAICPRMGNLAIELGDRAIQAEKATARDLLFEETSLHRDEIILLMRAVNFAARKHKDQRRKDAAASPYVNHPIALATVLVEEGGVLDVDILCGALLHDTIEDTDATKDELTDQFGEAIAEIVCEVTDDKSLGKAMRKRAQIEHAPQLSPQARAIKLADKICNLRDVAECPPTDWSLERCQAYFDWAKEVIDGLRGHHPSLEAIFDQLYERRPG